MRVEVYRFDSESGHTSQRQVSHVSIYGQRGQQLQMQPKGQQYAQSESDSPKIGGGSLRVGNYRFSPNFS